jgi:WD40 repeat protein
MSITSISLSAANANIENLSNESNENFLTSQSHAGSRKAKKEANTENVSASRGFECSLPNGVMVMEGHTKTVTSLSCSADNCFMVSVSDDGSMRVWDIWTRQCVREVKPMNKTAISNSLVRNYILLYCDYIIAMCLLIRV